MKRSLLRCPITPSLVPVLLLLATASVGAQTVKRYWMSAASTRPDFWSMFAPSASWDSALALADVFSIHVNALRERDTAMMRLAIARLGAAHVKVAFECGGLRPFSGCDSLAGEHHAALELGQLNRWYSRGGPIDFISMDSPINTMIADGDPSGTCGWTVAHAASEMVDYMKAVRARLPGVTFGLVEPVPWYRVGTYPNHPGNDYGDLLKTLDTVLAVVAARGETLAIFHSDSPFEYSDYAPTDGWNKLKAVEDYLHAHGVRHGRISNSQEGGFTSNRLFEERMLASFEKFAAVGGDPDELEVWCWYDHPDVNVPDSLPYTFTHACREFFVLAGATGAGLPLPAPVVLYAPEDRGHAAEGGVTLYWAVAKPLVDRYHVQYGLDSTMGSNIADDSTVTATQYRSSVWSIDEWYFWRVRAHNETGWGPWSPTWRLRFDPASVPPEEAAIADVVVTPNPVRDAATVLVVLARPGACTVEIVDLLGRPVAALVSGMLEVGSHTFTLDPARLGGTGTYFVRVRAGSLSVTRPMRVQR